MAIKNPTQWYAPSGKGFTITVGNLPIVTNAFLPIVTNLLLPIVTTPTYMVGRYATNWTLTGV